MDRKTVSAHLRKQFFPLLIAGGFTRSGDILRRELDGPVVHVVEVQHRPRSGVFQVNLGAHLAALGGVAGGTPVPAEQMREYDCAWRSSVVSGFRNSSDSEFAYGSTEAEASESVAFLVSEWERQSSEFFSPLSRFPESFHERASSSVDAGLHPAHLLTWARVADILGDAALRTRIVEAALPTVPERATSLRAQLLELS
ncbi:DUF4304 domain-containing protein [Microbacterium arabinogalactanolyticum]|uniref:DUF4304 domain-containing protein n=1 Tax=Microbacterium arabinogalactanolyticum TaxID=69365 RepID=UPI004043D58E